ncbi:PE family protein [Mycobacterium xenopi 3993]|nr:PE family protein [Mycobacterium xenopi 3993]
MSYVTTLPEALAAASSQLRGIGSALAAQNAAAAARRREWPRGRR